MLHIITGALGPLLWVLVGIVIGAGVLSRIEQQERKEREHGDGASQYHR